MPIGTSNGEYFEDAFDQAHTEMFGAKGTYDPKTDTFVADTEPTPKEIYLARHGDTDKNVEGEKTTDRAPIRGPDDTPLNEKGIEQAHKLAENVSKEPITHIVSSPVPRALKTAQIVGDRLGITPEIHPDLAAWDLGDLVGKTGKEAHDAVDRLCLNTPDARAPGGESFNEFKDRVLNAFGEIAETHKEHEVMVVGHGSTIRAFDAYDQDTGKFDHKAYHQVDDPIAPGQHKKFTIKDPAQLQQGTGPSFEERWPLPKSLQESLPSPLDVPHGNDEVQGWWKYGPKQTEQQKLDDRRQRQLQMQRELNQKRGFDTIESNDEPLKLSPYPEFKQIAMQGKPYDVIAKQSTQLEGGGTSGRIGATTTGDPILGYAQQGLGVKDIAEKLGLHRNTVNYWLNKLGFPRNQNISKGVDWEKFDTLLKDGKTIAQATQEMGLSQDAYYARQSRLRAQEKKSEPSLPKLDIQKKDLPEQDQDYINELSKWMKNQFEGGPSEPEMVDSMKQYLTDKSTTQFRRAANQNYAPNTPEREEFARNATKDFIKNFNKTAEDVSKIPIEEVRAKRKELAMKQAEKSATAAAAEEFGFKFMQTLKKIASDTKKLNRFSDILKEEVEKAATERRAKEAIKKRKDFKIVPPEEE